MKYVLLLHMPAVALADVDAGDRDAEMRAYAELKAELEAEGIWLGGQALQPAHATTQVQVRGDDVLVVDGPLVESAEQVAGYYLLECRDLDEAMAVAARVPGARHGTVEVRPVLEYERLLRDGEP